MTMNDLSERAARALLEGDRTKAEGLLRQKGEANWTPQDQWMMGTSLDLSTEGDTEDDTEDNPNERERDKLLQRVHRSGAQPYAKMAGDIMKREQAFKDEMNKRGAFEQFVHRWRPLFMRIIITVSVLAGVLVFLFWYDDYTNGPTRAAATEAIAATQAAAATQAVLALTPTVTPVPTNASAQLQSQMNANYQPVGSVTVLSWNPNTTDLLIGNRNGQPIPPNAGSKYAVVKIAFTCGRGLANEAQCNNPPEAEEINLILDDNNRTSVPYTGKTVIGGEQLTAVALGARVEGWLAFDVPQNLTPTAIEFVVSMSEDRNVDPEVFAIPLR